MADARTEQCHQSMNELNRYKLGFAAIVCLWLGACAVQHTRVAHGTIPAASSPTVGEDAAGRQIFHSLREDYPLHTGSLRRYQLSDVFTHLAESATTSPSDWRVFLFDAPDIADVRAVPGNYIFVWSGIFDVVEDESELAGLLACEIAHGLARHTAPVEFSGVSELLFSLTDTATTVGLLLLTQGAINISGTGMTRWAYVEAVDLDPVDRVYDDEQVEDMAAIALLILEASDYSTEGLLKFWKRVESDNRLRKKTARLSRDIPPDERVAIFEAAMPSVPPAHQLNEPPADVARQATDAGGNNSI